MYDVIIVGAGPAGLFAADKLIKQKLRVLVIDERSYPGGSAINDGKLNLTHKIGMYFNELGITQQNAETFINYVDSTLLRLGVDNMVYGEDLQSIERWVRKAAEFGIEFIPARQRHLGTDNSKRIWNSFYQELVQRGVNFLLNTKVNDIQKNDSVFSVASAESAYQSKFLLVAPGRGGSYWFRQQAIKLCAQTEYGTIDVGIRVEVPYNVFKPITDIQYDPKFIFTTKCHGDKTRTFCTNPKGFVKIEPRENGIPYRGGIAYPLNGDAYKRRKSKNTNFALLHTIDLTEPDEDTTEFGRNSVISCYTLGGGKPLVQRLGDLLNGNRSKESTFFDNRAGIITPTLAVPKKATPGDISLAYNGRTMDNLIETLIILGKMLPGVADPSTILYAPEVKFYDTKYPPEGSLETTLSGLFVAGDGSGKSRGIVGAALTGILAAESILKHH